MNLTRRAFLVSLAMCALSACSSGGSAAPDKWHTIVVEGLQVSVPSDAKMDDDSTMSFDTINANSYFIKGNDIVVQVDVLHDGGDITGEYEAREVNGMTVYTNEQADGVTEVLVPHAMELYGLMLYATKKGSKAEYEAARDHLIESLRF